MSTGNSFGVFSPSPQFSRSHKIVPRPLSKERSVASILTGQSFCESPRTGGDKTPRYREFLAKSGADIPLCKISSHFETAAAAWKHFLGLPRTRSCRRHPPEGRRAGCGHGPHQQCRLGPRLYSKGLFHGAFRGGDLRLVVIRGKPDKNKLVGDAEQQALIRASQEAVERLTCPALRLRSIEPAPYPATPWWSELNVDLDALEH